MFPVEQHGVAEVVYLEPAEPEDPEPDDDRRTWYDEHAAEPHPHQYVSGTTLPDGRVQVSWSTDDDDDCGYPCGRDSRLDNLRESSCVAFWRRWGPTHWGAGGPYVEVQLDGYLVTLPSLEQHLAHVAAIERKLRAEEHAEELAAAAARLLALVEGSGPEAAAVRALLDAIDGKEVPHAPVP